MRPVHGPRLALNGLVAICGLAALAGCNSRSNVTLTGTAPPEAAHLWVTVDALAFATEADTPPESDTGWIREQLSSPVVVDLASLDTGKLVALASNLAIPAGTYQQMQLGLADAGDRLLPAARDLGLDYNAQIEIPKASGAVTKAPLERPVPGTGLTFPVDLTLEDRSGAATGGSSTSDVTNLAVTLDAARDVVTYAYGSKVGYLLSPSVAVNDLDGAGAITGRVDASALGATRPAITVSAQVEDASGTHHVVVQRREVATDGSFTLSPLPAPKKGTKSYDVVIACAGADTVIIRGVAVARGSDATVLQPEAIALTSARTVYANTGAQTPSLPAGTRVEFYQSLSGRGELPYVIDGTALDPLSREFPDGAFALASGFLVSGQYASGAAIVLSTTTPAEGSGAFVVGSAGPYRADTLASSAVDVSGGSNRPTLVKVPYPQLANGGRSGTLTVELRATSGRFNAGFVAVQAGSRLVDTVEVGRLLERGGGTVSIKGLPAGSALAATAGVPYQVAVRAWNSGNPAGTITRVAAPASVTLGDAGTGSLLLQIP